MWKKMITHVMSDGTRRKSMDGITIPRDHPVYGVIQKMYKMEGMESEATQKADKKPKGRIA